MSKLLAPNGKPSNLTPEQYKLVRSSAFKKWFGDWENDPVNASKVVDDNGEPLVVYHGTNSEFYQFKNNLKAYYFSVDEKYAQFVINNYKNENGKEIILKCFLNIRKITKVKFPIEKNNVALFLNEYNRIESMKEKNGGLQGFDDLEKEHLIDIENQKINNQVYVCLNPNQIKLANGTNTTFDANNPDIRFEDGGEVNTGLFSQIWEWFGIKF